MSQVWSSMQCMVFIPPCHPRAKSLAPLTQPDLDAFMPIVTRAAVQLGRHVSHPITLQYLQRNYHLLSPVSPTSLVLALGYFDELRKHVLGGTGWSVAMAQLLLKPLYVFDLDMEQWYWWNSTLQQYQPCEGMTEEQIDKPSHVTRQNSDCRHPRKIRGGLSHDERFI